MSESIVQTMDSSAGPAELLSWRDAITPLGRSSRRRWAVAYALLLVLGGLLVAVMALTALVVLVMLPDFERTDRLVLWGTLWAIYLPTGVLAWREPDLLSAGPEWSSGGLSERPRDALLAVALGGALTLAFLGFGGLLALLPLIAVLTLLCGLARRARK
jgi:hypothetical protein